MINLTNTAFQNQKKASFNIEVGEFVFEEIIKPKNAQIDDVLITPRKGGYNENI